MIKIGLKKVKQNKLKQTLSLMEAFVGTVSINASSNNLVDRTLHEALQRKVSLLSFTKKLYTDTWQLSYKA